MSDFHPTDEDLSVGTPILLDEAVDGGDGNSENASRSILGKHGKSTCSLFDSDPASISFV
jgi:hypothetical protein